MTDGRGYPRRLADGRVARLEPGDARGLSRHLRRREPALLARCALVGGLDHWDLPHLAAHFGDAPLPVHHVPRGTTAFARHYGAGLGVGGVRHMPFAAFVAAAEAQLTREGGASGDGRR